MKYIELLDNEDIKYICNTISGEKFKKMFISSPKEFSKIKPGFRPNKMSDKEAVELAIKNLNKEFIRKFIDAVISEWMKEIGNCIEEVQRAGREYDDAVAVTLLGSYFADNINLYFKLMQSEKDVDYILGICNKMVSIAQKRGNENDKVGEYEGNGGYNELLAMPQDLESKIETLEKQKTIAEKQIDDLDKANKDVKSQLFECQKELKELQDEHKKNMVELEDLRERAEHEIVVNEESFKSDEYDFISLCEVLPDCNGTKFIERYADLTEQREFEKFYVDEGKPRKFENRDKLYYKESREVGTMGVWMWSAGPNNNDPNKDFINSQFVSEIKPIEVLSFDDQVSNEKELLDLLKTGIDLDTLSEVGMYSIHMGKGHYIGFLCNAHDFEKVGEKKRIKSTLNTLDKYEFGSTEFIKLDNGRRFFKKLSLGIPRAVIPVKDTMELIKNIILSRNSWASFKEAGKNRGEWKLIKKFLEELDVSLISREIAEALNCSQSDAVEKIDEFVSMAASYIDGNSIEDSIVESVIASDENLSMRCKNLLREEWEVENRAEILNKQSELKSLEDELAECRKQLETVNSDRNKYENEILKFKDELSLKEQLATDVENAVAKRISAAQANVADFIAEMAFVNAPVRLEEYAYCEHESKSGDISTADVDSSILTQMKEEADEDWEMTLDSIEGGLIRVGVMERFARPMAAYLYSSYLLETNILLTGPNAEAIAQAFSCAVTGKLARKLYCKQSAEIDLYRNQICKGEVIIIENPFDPEWVSQIPNFMSGTDAFYIGIHPFIEDLQIEPKSFFNYMLPLFTDCVVGKAPTNTFTCSRKADNYTEFDCDYSKKDNSKVLSVLHVPSLTKNRLQLIAGNMHSMLEEGEADADFDVMFALLPYAYSTMQMPALYEMLEDSGKSKISVSKQMMKYLKEIYGGFDE